MLRCGIIRQKCRYDMLTASMVLGVHVKIPVSALNVAPAEGPDCRLSVTSSPSLSDVVTFSVTFLPIVAFNAALVLITGLLLAEIIQRA